MPGPVPKRSSQRRRRNKEGGEVTTLAVSNPSVEQPPADPSWPAIVTEWYTSLAESAQAHYYEPSDWRHAVLVAEIMAQEFNALYETGKPLRAMQLQVIFAEMTNLMTTEGARRRLRLEVERAKAEDAKEEAAVVSMMEKYKEAF